MRTRGLRIAEMPVERGEVGEFAGPRQKLEETARRFLGNEQPVDAEPEELRQRLVETERREQDLRLARRKQLRPSRR